MADDSNLALQSATLKRIQDMAVEAAGIKNKIAIVEPPGSDKERGYWLFCENEDPVYHEFASPYRRHTLRKLDQVPQYVAYAVEKLAATPVVWFSETGVSIILDDKPDSQRRDYAQLAFTTTPEAQMIIGWVADEGSPEFSQKDLIKLLRTTLSACETSESLQLLRIVRDLESKTRTGARGRIGHGQESLGRDIENEVTSAIGEIPEATQFRLRLLDDPLLTATFAVQCAIEIDPQTLTIELFPRADDVREAVDATHAIIGDYLRRECAETPLFYGNP